MKPKVNKSKRVLPDGPPGAPPPQITAPLEGNTIGLTFDVDGIYETPGEIVVITAASGTNIYTQYAFVQSDQSWQTQFTVSAAGTYELTPSVILGGDSSIGSTVTVTVLAEGPGGGIFETGLQT